MTDMEKARLIINETDKEMAKLFEKRMDAARMIGEYKKEHGLPVEDIGREEAIIERNSAYVENEEYRSYYVNFLRSSIELSKKLQHRIFDGMRVAYSGVEGAFANIVTKRVFPDATAVACSDFSSAYNAVVNGDCDCALLPIENSYNGDVGNVMDLAFFGSLYVTGVYEAEIIQNLLAVKGASIGDIKTVISHPQALGQCAKYIEKHGFKAVEAVNTAVAAKQVAQMGRVDTAAIGSEEAAMQFGLVKLESHINQSSQNTTRFAVFSRTPKVSSEDKHFIMLFTVNNTAGSLGKAVSIIGEYGINLRALKSRPTKELIWDYYFYAEGEGDFTSSRVKEMVSELEKYCNYLKILGTYEKEVRV